MKLSQYVIEYLKACHLKHVFALTGGAAAHLMDAFHGQTDIGYVCVQHEQAGAMAAEAYSRITGAFGAMIATSGPGATNLLTGICCAWFDSVPALYLCGQVNTFESKGDTGSRQVGFQETDIVDIVRPVTKYAVRVEDPATIRFHLDKALHLAQSGRPGPVLIDLPMDVQRAEIDPGSLPSFEADDETAGTDWTDVETSLHLIEGAARPVLLLGGGVRLSGSVELARKLVDRLGIPVVVTWGALDLLSCDHPLLIGNAGVYGNRGANFAVQNSDLVISLGSRLDTRLTGGKPETFARNARKIVVDLDAGELHKGRGLIPDVPICGDLYEYLSRMLARLDNARISGKRGWLERCLEWKRRYPAVQPEWRDQTDAVNPYVFMEALSEQLDEHAVIIPDCGANLCWTVQGFRVKQGQRLFSSMGNSPMGYSLAAAIGACFAMDQKPVVCIIGDGGIQINIQELQTIAHYRLPIKIFVLDNAGYGIIKQFQEMYLGGRYEASGNGYSRPDLVRIAQAYGIRAAKIGGHGELTEGIRQTLEAPEATLCDVVLRPDQKIIPKLEFGRPIEDLSPLLDRDELRTNMLIRLSDAIGVSDDVVDAVRDDEQIQV